jgi:hypothetical protein
MPKRQSDYTLFGVSLTEGQQETIAKAVQAGVNITIRLANEQLRGKDSLALTKRQIAHIEKKQAAGAGAEVTLSKTQLKHAALINITKKDVAAQLTLLPVPTSAEDNLDIYATIVIEKLF